MSEEIEKRQYKGYTHTVRTDATQNENGMWDVLLKYTQDRSQDLEKWERRFCKFRVMDKELGHGIYMANFTLTQLLDAYNGDIFNAPESEIKTNDSETDSNKDTGS